MAASVRSGSRRIASRTAYSSRPIRSRRVRTAAASGNSPAPATDALNECRKLRRFMDPLSIAPVLGAAISPFRPRTGQRPTGQARRARLLRAACEGRSRGFESRFPLHLQPSVVGFPGSSPSRRRSQVVRQRSAKPPSPVQIRAAPPTFLRKINLSRHRDDARDDAQARAPAHLVLKRLPPNRIISTTIAAHSSTP